MPLWSIKQNGKYMFEAELWGQTNSESKSCSEASSSFAN
jgi:hypothetical protein